MVEEPSDVASFWRHFASPRGHSDAERRSCEAVAYEVTTAPRRGATRRSREMSPRRREEELRGGRVKGHSDAGRRSYEVVAWEVTATKTRGGSIATPGGETRIVTVRWTKAATLRGNPSRPWRIGVRAARVEGLRRDISPEHGPLRVEKRKKR